MWVDVWRLIIEPTAWGGGLVRHSVAFCMYNAGSTVIIIINYPINISNEVPAPSGPPLSIFGLRLVVRPVEIWNMENYYGRKRSPGSAHMMILIILIIRKKKNETIWRKITPMIVFLVVVPKPGIQPHVKYLPVRLCTADRNYWNGGGSHCLPKSSQRLWRQYSDIMAVCTICVEVIT